MKEETVSRLAIVTGFTSGIGLETVRGLALEGWRVIGIARCEERGRRIAEILRAQTGNPRIHFRTADLSSIRDTRKLAASLLEDYPAIDLLVNNAGALYRWRGTTDEGLERTFALNHLGPFVLTTELMPALKGRVLTISSAAHHKAAYDPDDLQMSGHYRGWEQYCRSKLMNILFTRELARRLPEPVTATCLHPGFVETCFGMKENGILWPVGLKLMMVLTAISAELSARAVLHVAVDDDLSVANGQYFDRGHPTLPSEAAQDDELAEKLWNESEAIVARFKEEGESV